MNRYLWIFATLLICVVATTTASAQNFKKDYCGGNEFVGNDGTKYPHLHCGKDFLTLSRSKSDHVNLQGKSNCNKVDEILQDKQRNYGNANNPDAITTALTAFKNAGCP